MRTILVLVALLGAACAGPGACERYCQRSGDCLGRLDDVPACIDTCEAQVASGMLSGPRIERCADCFSENSCPEITAGNCVTACE